MTAQSARAGLDPHSTVGQTGEYLHLGLAEGRPLPLRGVRPAVRQEAVVQHRLLEPEMVGPICLRNGRRPYTDRRPNYPSRQQYPVHLPDWPLPALLFSA
jgi:hypothetical protein